MVFIKAVFLGIVQGLTEFFPISSSGHLLILHDFLHFGIVDSLSFDAALHLGTLIALLIFFWKDIIRLIGAFFKSIIHWRIKTDTNQQEVWFVILAAIPAGIVGVILESSIENKFRSAWVVVVSLVIGAVAFWVVEAWVRRRGLTTKLTWGRALIIGLTQVIALIPGISRSGATLTASLGSRLPREQAARFSFLVSIPVVAGAGAIKLLDLLHTNLPKNELLQLFLGILSSAIVGFFVIRFFIKFISRYTLSAFAWYRVIAALIIAVLLIVR
jgi:undecaprenyl-diphosphatase